MRTSSAAVRINRERPKYILCLHFRTRKNGSGQPGSVLIENKFRAGCLTEPCLPPGENQYGRCYCMEMIRV